MKQPQSKNPRYIFAAIFTLAFLFALLVVAANMVYPAVQLITTQPLNDVGQQFSYLAQSFLHGKLYFLHIFDWRGEPAFFEGKAYSPFGPAPAVLLVPFVFIAEKFGVLFYQGFLNAPIFFVVGFLVYFLARQWHYSKRDSVLLSFALCFASPLIFVAISPISNYFAHVITVCLIFLAFLEYFREQRWWVIGILFGVILVTRFTAALGILFFVWHILVHKEPFQKKARNLAKLLLPFFFFVLLYGLYNWLRFNNVFETGYALQSLPFQSQTDIRSTGLYGINHLATNAYHMLVALPADFGKSLVPLFRNDSNGISIFLTSMYLLYFFRIKNWNKEATMLLVTSVVISIPLLLSWSTGFYQIGYRFSLDFLPFLFVALALNLKRQYGKLPTGFSVLVLVSMIFNYYLLVVASVLR